MVQTIDNATKRTYRVGIDVGSTTIKVVFLDEHGRIIFSDYRRHHADIERNLFKARDRRRVESGENHLQLGAIST